MLLHARMKPETMEQVKMMPEMLLHAALNEAVMWHLTWKLAAMRRAQKSRKKLAKAA